MRPVCRYEHLGILPPWPGAVLLPPPVLQGIRNRAGRCIAWQCPVCLRTWDASRHGEGKPGYEIAPLDVHERRRAMIEAAEEVQK